VANWKFYALQTEENAGSEKAMALDLESCRNIRLANLFMYRIRATAEPHPFAIRLRNSSGILFRGVHNFSGGPFPFDTTLFNMDTGLYTAQHEIAYMTVR